MLCICIKFHIVSLSLSECEWLHFQGRQLSQHFSILKGMTLLFEMNLFQFVPGVQKKDRISQVVSPVQRAENLPTVIISITGSVLPTYLYQGSN